MSNPWEPAAPDPTPAVPAGWYPDPAGSGGQRWWDGTQWSEHVQPPAVPAAPETPAAPAEPAGAVPVVPVEPTAPVAPAVPAPSYQPVPAAPAYGAAAYGAAGGYGAAPGINQYVQARSVGFGEAISRAFRSWGDYSSRSTLSEFWWFFLFEFLVGIVLYIIAIVFVIGAAATSAKVSSDGQITSTSAGLSGVAIIVLLLLFVVGIVLFLVYLPLTVRRLHDTDKSGWFYLLAFIPFGSIIVLVLCAMAGTPGPNRYGPVPQ
jgi:uncharacterized membrane protein YhaH (DUF805 family)